MHSHDPMLGQVSGLAKKLMKKEGIVGSDRLRQGEPFDEDGRPVLVKDGGGYVVAWWAYRRRAKQMIGRMVGRG